MVLALLIAAQAALVPVAAGDALLAHPDAAVSQAAQAVLAQGGSVTCRKPTPTLAAPVCLTVAEWRGVVRDARLIDRRTETAKELSLFAIRSAAR